MYTCRFKQKSAKVLFFFLGLMLSTNHGATASENISTSKSYVPKRTYKLCFKEENTQSSLMSFEDNLRDYGLPSSYDIRSLIGGDTRAVVDLPVYDQFSLGSCTANAAAGAMQFLRLTAKQSPNFSPSRLFIYYVERSARGTINYDSGATIADSVRALISNGACDEKIWPYTISQFKTKPSTTAYTEAKRYVCLDRISQIKLSQTKTSIAGALSKGWPVLGGFMLYQSSESDETEKTGNLPFPNTGKEAFLGGHALMLVGYNDQSVTIRNSWGTDWGNKGYGTIPWEYVLNSKLAGDFWTVTKISNKPSPSIRPSISPFVRIISIFFMPQNLLNSDEEASSKDAIVRMTEAMKVFGSL